MKYLAIPKVSAFTAIKGAWRQTEPWISVICFPWQEMIKFLRNIGWVIHPRSISHNNNLLLLFQASQTQSSIQERLWNLCSLCFCFFFFFLICVKRPSLIYGSNSLPNGLKSSSFLLNPDSQLKHMPLSFTRALDNAIAAAFLWETELQKERLGGTQLNHFWLCADR